MTFPRCFTCRGRAKAAVSRTADRGRRRARPWRPWLEGLEDRRVPSTVTNLNDSGSGSLRQAILDTPSGGRVDFQSGLHGRLVLTSGELTVDKNLTIAGPGKAILTVSGNAASRVFDVTAVATVTISGLTIAEGKVVGLAGQPAAQGGAILNAGTLALLDSTVSDSQAVGLSGPAGGGLGQDAVGGGIFSSGTLNLVKVEVTRNFAAGGDGDTTQGNGGTGGAAFGGGIRSDGPLALSSSVVDNNTAIGGAGGNGLGAGGVGGDGGNAAGGSLFSLGANTNLTNSAVDENRAAGGAPGTGLMSGRNGHPGFSHGGGLFENDGVLTLLNATVARNEARVGGGISLTGPVTTVALTNTIVATNRLTSGSSSSDGPDVSGAVTSASHNLIGDGSGSSGLVNGVNGNQVGTASGPIDPRLGSLKDNGGPTPSLALLPQSPAIDRGTNAGAPPTDQRSFHRIVNGTTDVGAYEFQPPITTTTLASDLAENQELLAGRGITFPATVTVLAPGSNAPEGTVTLLDNGTALPNETVPLGGGPAPNTGVAAFANVKLPPGKHLISARYDGFTQGDYTLDSSQSVARTQVVRSGAFFAVGGGNGHVQVRRAGDGSLLFDFLPYGPGYTGPVNVAVGDLTFDGFEELVTAAAVGNPDVRVYDGQAIVKGTFNPANPDASRLAQLFPYAIQFNVGASVAVGDVNGDGFGDLITGADVGNPDVRVYSGKDIANHTFDPNGASLLAQWFAYGLQFNIGANVAAGDLNADGFADVVTAATAGNPHVKVYDGAAIAAGTFNRSNPDASLLAQVFPFALQFNVGAFVAVGDVNGDGFNDLITGSSIGNPQVKTYDGKAIASGSFTPANAEAHKLDDFFAYGLGANVGVTVGAADLEGSGKADILAGATNGPAEVRSFRGVAGGANPPAVLDLLLAGFPPGVAVGAA